MESLTDERYVKRKCGCQIELVDTKGGPSKLYLQVCANHRMDWKFRELINGLIKKFDEGLQEYKDTGR